MNIFVAGASGAIGQPLIAELVRRGHTVTGMTHSEAGAQNIRNLGAGVAFVSAFDVAEVERALRETGGRGGDRRAYVAAQSPADMAAAAPGDRKLRLEGGGNLYRAAKASGVRRYIQQASGFFLKTSGGLADESDGLGGRRQPWSGSERAHVYRA